MDFIRSRFVPVIWLQDVYDSVHTKKISSSRACILFPPKYQLGQENKLVS